MLLWQFNAPLTDNRYNLFISILTDKQVPTLQNVVINMILSELATLVLAFIAFTASAQPDGTVYISENTDGTCDGTIIPITVQECGNNVCCEGPCTSLQAGFNANSMQIFDSQNGTSCFMYESNADGCNGNAPIEVRKSGSCQSLSIGTPVTWGWVSCSRCSN